MTWTDERLREAIVQSYEGELFTVPLSDVTRPSRRRPMWIGAAALATAAATFTAVTTIGGSWRDATPPVDPAATSSTARPNPTAASYVGISFGEVESACRRAGLPALQDADELPENLRQELPSKYRPTQGYLRGTSEWDEPRGPANMWLFANDRVLVQCVRYGRDGLDVSVTDVSDGNAPWLRADELPFFSGRDASGLSYIAGWLPADTEYFYFSVRYNVALTVYEESFRGLIPKEGAGWPYIVSLPPNTVGEVTITVYTEDRIIKRIGDQLATSAPR